MERENNNTQQPGVIVNGNIDQLNIGSTVTNNYNNGEPKVAATSNGQNVTAIDKAQLRKEIIEYVGRIESFYSVAWQQHYKELWNDILDMPSVAIKVYDHGHQQDTNFNRNLVGNIIGYLDRFALYQDTIVPGTFTHKLAKDGKGKSVRDALGGALDPEICEAIKRLMDTKKYI